MSDLENRIGGIAVDARTLRPVVIDANGTARWMAALLSRQSHLRGGPVAISAVLRDGTLLSWFRSSSGGGYY